MLFYRMFDILIIILSISLLLCFVRLYLGPNLPNRTVAFDAITVHAMGIVALFAIRSESAVLLDVTIVTAVLGFLGTTMLARYLEKTDVEGWRADAFPEVPPRRTEYTATSGVTSAPQSKSETKG